MSSTTKNLVDLSERLCAHQGITHWAVSMRLFGKGDFFRRIENGTRPYADTVERGMRAISEIWPTDLEWPEHIARPVRQEESTHDDA